MTTPNFLDALLALLVALAQPAAPPEAAPVPAPVPAQAQPVCARLPAPGGDPLRAAVALTAGGSPIVGEVIFAFELTQGTNRVRQRLVDAVALAPGESLRRDVAIAVNGSGGPSVTVRLPDGSALRCT